MKRVSIVFGVVLLLALAGIVVQREVALSDRVGALSGRVTQLEGDKSDLLAQVSELGYELNGATSRLESEIQARKDLEANLIDWTDSANQLFGVLLNKPGPTTLDDNPCGPGSLPPFINEDGVLTCW